MHACRKTVKSFRKIWQRRSPDAPSCLTRSLGSVERKCRYILFTQNGRTQYTKYDKLAHMFRLVKSPSGPY